MPKISTLSRPAVAVNDLEIDLDDDDNDFGSLGAPLRPAEPRTLLRETRDADVRPDSLREVMTDDNWMSPTNLQMTPPPRPGMAQRWIRFEARGDHDTLNWNRKFRMGWQPRDPATLPQTWRHMPKHRASGQGADMITIAGMVLCEAPTEMITRYRRIVAERQMKLQQAVSHDTDAASRDGAKIGAPPIIREEELTASRGRQPRTLAE